VNNAENLGGNVRFAVLGTGRIGRMHAENVARHPAADLAMVFDVDRASADAVAERHGARTATSAEDALDAREIDAVLVATATPTHADYIEAAVAAGKPVLCEKPIDLSLDRVNACAERIEGSGVPVQIGFNRRFDPGHRAARDRAHSGEIGAIHQVVITARDPEMPPRAYYEAAGGLLRDMTIHDFDLARFILPDEPAEVFATAGRLVDPRLMEELDDHDTAMILLVTASGRQCHINNSRTAVYGYDQRVEILGTRGMLLSDNVRRNAVRRHGEDETEAGAPYLHFFAERYAEAFVAELDAFVSAVRDGTPPQATFEDGRMALVLAEAAYRSLAERRVVRVDELV
jgi:myo-inositol 2-dehydrogenase/D-chiro-inositol 1-dehydrogenase